jgi:hypothetical protein
MKKSPGVRCTLIACAAALLGCGNGAGIATLPFAVDDLFVPGGYFGDGATPGALVDSPCQTRAGNRLGKCHKFSWTPITPATSYAGVYWLYPDNNWGKTNLPGQMLPAGAKSISFWAWGQKGGETITFFAGLSPNDGFHVVSSPLALTTTPTQYTISLLKVSYSTVISGFGWSAGAQGAGPTVFFLDDVEWQAAAPTGTTPGCTDAGAANYNAGATADDGSCLYAVTFQLDLSKTTVPPSAKVQVRATFNGFCDNCNPLVLGTPASAGRWSTTLPLKPGAYQFKYATDSSLAGFETVPAACAANPNDPADHRNRPLVVTAAAQTLPPVAFGACP